MAPKIISLLKKNKRKHNQGPISPITRRDVERAGSLEGVYQKRTRHDPFAQDVMARVKRSKKMAVIGHKHEAE